MSTCTFSDPASMRRATVRAAVQLGAFLLLAAPSLAAEDCWHEDGNHVVCLSRFAPPEYKAYQEVWGYEAGGVELALIGAQRLDDTTGLLIVDVSSPETPREVAFFPGGWDDIDTYLHYAYTSDDTIDASAYRTLLVVDLSDPLNPVLAANSQQFHGHTIFVDDEAGTLYSSGQSRGPLRIYSLADPVAPQEIGVASGLNPHDVYVRDGLAYVSSSIKQRLWVLDVSPPSAPQRLSWLGYAGALTHSSWLSGDGRFLFGADEVYGGRLRVFDVEDPAHPVLVSSWRHPDPGACIHNPYVVGDLLFCSWYTAGLQVFDVGSPEFPDVVASYDTNDGTGWDDHGAWGTYPFAFPSTGNVYMSDIDTGLHILRVEPEYGVVDGAVTDAVTGDPIADAVIEIPSAGRSIATNASGYFRFCLDPGIYEVRADAFAHVGQTRFANVIADGVATLDMALQRQPAGSLRGRVTAESGSPIPGAEVAVAGTPLRVSSGPDGSFLLPSIPTAPDSQWTISASKLGYGRQAVLYEINAEEDERHDFVLKASCFVESFEFPSGWTALPEFPDTMTGPWQRRDPAGTGGGEVQPEDDHTPGTGHICFVTGATHTENNWHRSNDVDPGTKILLSPVLDLTACVRPALSYYRWYSEGQLNAPRNAPFYVDVSSDGGATWRNVETLTETRNFWERVDVDLDDFITPTDRVQIRFVAAEPPPSYLRHGDEEEDYLVEAAIDDVEIYEHRSTTDVPSPAGPVSFDLYPPVPNPFPPGGTLRFGLAARQRVTLDVIDVQGRLVRRLLDGVVEPGDQGITWDGRTRAGAEAPTGIYWIRMRAGSEGGTARLLLIR